MDLLKNNYMHIQKLMIFITFLFTAILFLFTTNTYAFSSSNFSLKTYTTTANVRLRNNLNKTLKTVKKNTTVNVIGSLNDYYIVILKNKQIGYISKKYLKQSSTTQKFVSYTNVQKYNVKVAKNNVNLRAGPSTTFKTYKKLKINTTLEVIGNVSNFLVVITSDNYVGFVRNDMVKKEIKSDSSLPNTKATALSNINKARKNKGLSNLKEDSFLSIIAQKKSDDMVKNSYFSHNSKTYGTPFEMMKKAGILYSEAGESIAGNASVESALNLLINDNTKNKNIFSKSFDYIGIGITKSDVYGYIVVLMFIKKP